MIFFDVFLGAEVQINEEEELLKCKLESKLHR